MLTRGQAVRLNCVPLLGNTANPAGVQYCSAGVVVAASPHPTVPFSCLTSSQVLQDDFKIFFMKVVGKLNSVGKMDGELGSKPPPNKFPKSFFRLVAGKMCSMLPKPEYLVLATTKPAPKPKTAETRKSEKLPPGVSSDEAVPPAGLSLELSVPLAAADD